MEAKNHKRIFLILAILLIVLAAGVGVYYLRQGTINSLKSQNQTAADNNQKLQSQIDSLQNTIKQFSASTPAAIPSQPAYTGTAVQSVKGVTVVIYSPSVDSKVQSPIGVIGLVPGGWSSEAQFPVKLEDNTGAVIAETVGHVVGPWMTNNLEPFYAQLSLPSNPGLVGAIVLQKDNPSGLSANNDSVTIPVRF
jgi:outer membrane murein-binding lipoprotein Lpp